ncbi:fibronectin type III domain-containing protein [Paenibacillus caseinilyticus]|nr:fibronectin type III domain-containing protein [Paenibacillus mucilaginosus]AFH63807.1 hypothetical protein B2K_24490 [Paenibacillus mucilaginosus K02]
MKRMQKIGLISTLLAALMPLPAMAAEGIYLDIGEPQEYMPYGGEELPIRVYPSGEEIQSMTAQLDGRLISLSPDCADVYCTWSGSLPLEGVKHGVYPLQVKAAGAEGGQGSAERLITIDYVPELIRLEPAPNTIAAGGVVKVRVDAADGEDRSPYLIVSLVNAWGDVVASESGSAPFETTLQVQGYDGETLTLRVTESEGSEYPPRVIAERAIVIEASKRLETVASVDGTVIDYDADRILYANSGVLFLQERGSAKVTEVPRTKGRQISESARLTHSGVIFAAESAEESEKKLYVWSPGKKAKSTGVEYKDGGSLAVQGSSAVYIPGTGDKLYVIDTRDGRAEKVKARGVQSAAFEPDGSIVYAAGVKKEEGRKLFRRYTDGRTEALTVTGAVYDEPLSDGETVVFRGDGDRLLTLRGGEIGELAGTGSASSYEPRPHRDYEIQGGWIAYTAGSADGSRQVYLREPSGTVTQVTYGLTAPRIAGLGGDGTLAVQTDSELQLYNPQDGDLIRTGSAAGQVKGIQGQWFNALSGTILGIVSGAVDETAPVWPSPEPLSVSGVTDSKALLSWQPAEDEGGVQFYNITVLIPEMGYEVIHTEVPGSETSYELWGLSPGTAYWAAVEAVDHAGNRSEAALIDFTTEPYSM